MVLETGDCKEEKQDLVCCPGSLLDKYFTLAIKREREREGQERGGGDSLF